MVRSRAAASPAFSPVRFYCGALAAIVAAGLAVTAGPVWTAVVAVAVLALAAGPLVAGRISGLALAVEVPVLLLLASTLVWRVRASEQLAASPLDSAGAARTGMVVMAGFLGLVALLVPRDHPATPVPVAWRWYGAYVVVVFLGALVSVHPPLTAYRGVELTAGLVVMAGARRTAPDAARRLERVLYWFVVGQLASVWAGVVLVPSVAVIPLNSALVPVPWQVQGVYPNLSADSVGALGVLLVIWSVCRWPGQRRRQLPMVAFGLVSLAAAQHRTGYVALTCGLMVVLVTRRRWGLLAATVLLGGMLVAWNPAVVAQVGPYLLRGDTLEHARELNSRTDWWEAALPLWQRSPVIGRGLLTGTRFEVLAALGRTDTSSIHGTWIEALAGTGTLGCLFLAAGYLAAVVRAGRAPRRFPLAVLALIGVFSITGPTIEVAGQTSLLFLLAALASPPPDQAEGEGLVEADDRDLAGRAVIDRH